MFYGNKYSLCAKVISISLSVLLLFNDMVHALAPTSRFSPIARVVKNTDGTHDVVTDLEKQKKIANEIDKWESKYDVDPQQVRLYRDAKFWYIASLIGQYLVMDVSPDTLIDDIKIQIGMMDKAFKVSTRLEDGIITDVDDKLLFGAKLYEIIPDEDSYRLPVYREGRLKFYYRFYVDPSMYKDPDMTIPLGEEKGNVYVQIEKPGVKVVEKEVKSEKERGETRSVSQNPVSITDHRSPITDHRSPITDHRSPITYNRDSGVLKRNVADEDIEQAVNGDLSRWSIDKELKIINDRMKEEYLRDHPLLMELSDNEEIPWPRMLDGIVKARDDLVDPDGKPLKLFNVISRGPDCFAMGYASSEYLVYGRELIKDLPTRIKAEYLLHEALYSRFAAEMESKKAHQLARRVQKILFPENYPEDIEIKDGDSHPELTGKLTKHLNYYRKLYKRLPATMMLWFFTITTFAGAMARWMHIPVLDGALIDVPFPAFFAMAFMIYTNRAFFIAAWGAVISMALEVIVPLTYDTPYFPFFLKGLGGYVFSWWDMGAYVIGGLVVYAIIRYTSGYPTPFMKFRKKIYSMITGTKPETDAVNIYGKRYLKNKIIAERQDMEGNSAGQTTLVAKEVRKLTLRERDAFITEAKRLMDAGEIEHDFEYECLHTALRILKGKRDEMFDDPNEKVRVYVALSSPEQNSLGHMGIESFLMVRQKSEKRIRVVEQEKTNAARDHDDSHKYMFAGAADQIFCYAMNQEIARSPQIADIVLAISYDARKKLYRRGLSRKVILPWEDMYSYLVRRSKYIRRKLESDAYKGEKEAVGILRMMGYKIDDENIVKFPLTPDYIYSLDISRAEMGDSRKIAQRGWNATYNDKNGTEGVVHDIPDHIDTSRSIEFRHGDISLRCFRNMRSQKMGKDYFTYSISVNDEIVGHGFLTTAKDKIVSFRYGIHKAFRGRGYGTRALPVIMAAGVNKEVGLFRDRDNHCYELMPGMRGVHVEEEGMEALKGLCRKAGFEKAGTSLKFNLEASDKATPKPVMSARRKSILGVSIIVAVLLIELLLVVVIRNTVPAIGLKEILPLGFTGEGFRFVSTRTLIGLIVFRFLGENLAQVITKWRAEGVAPVDFRKDIKWYRVIWACVFAASYLSWMMPTSYAWWKASLSPIHYGIADFIFMSPITLPLWFVGSSIVEKIWGDKSNGEGFCETMKENLFRTRNTLCFALPYWAVVLGVTLSLPVSLDIQTFIVSFFSPFYAIVLSFVAHSDMNGMRMRRWAVPMLIAAVAFNVIYFPFHITVPNLWIGFALYTLPIIFGFHRVKKKIIPEVIPDEDLTYIMFSDLDSSVRDSKEMGLLIDKYTEFFESGNREMQKRFWTEKNGDFEAMIVLYDGIPCALREWSIEGDTCHSAGIYVLEDYRRRDIAYRLTANTLDYMKYKGYGHVKVELLNGSAEKQNLQEKLYRDYPDAVTLDNRPDGVIESLTVNLTEWPARKDAIYNTPDVPSGENVNHGAIRRDISPQEIEAAIDGDLDRRTLKQEFRLINKLFDEEVLSVNDELQVLAGDVNIPFPVLLALISLARDDLTDEDGKELKLFPAIVHSREKYALGYSTDTKLTYSRELIDRCPVPYRSEYLIHEALCYRLNEYISSYGNLYVDGHQLARGIQKIVFGDYYPNLRTPGSFDTNPELTGPLTILLRSVIREKAYAPVPAEVSEGNAVSPEHRFPLTPEVIYGLDPEKSTIADSEGFAERLWNEMYNDRNDTVGKTYTMPGWFDVSKSIEFTYPGYSFRCFRNMRTAEVGTDQFVFSICFDGRIIGHGVAMYIAGQKNMVFRYSIHKQFRVDRHGVRVLPFILSMCINREKGIFKDHDLEKIVLWGGLFPEEQARREYELLKMLLIKAGFRKDGEGRLSFSLLPGNVSRRLPGGALHEAVDTLNNNNIFQDRNRPFTLEEFLLKRLKPEENWEVSGVPEWYSRRTVDREIKALKRLGILEDAGRRGNAYIYRVTEIYERAHPMARSEVVNLLMLYLADDVISASPSEEEISMVKPDIISVLEDVYLNLAHSTTGASFLGDLMDEALEPGYYSFEPVFRGSRYLVDLGININHMETLTRYMRNILDEVMAENDEKRDVLTGLSDDLDTLILLVRQTRKVINIWHRDGYTGLSFHENARFMEIAEAIGKRHIAFPEELFYTETDKVIQLLVRYTSPQYRIFAGEHLSNMIYLLEGIDDSLTKMGYIAYMEKRVTELARQIRRRPDNELRFVVEKYARCDFRRETGRWVESPYEKVNELAEGVSGIEQAVDLIESIRGEDLVALDEYKRFDLRMEIISAVRYNGAYIHDMQDLARIEELISGMIMDQPAGRQRRYLLDAWIATKEYYEEGITILGPIEDALDGGDPDLYNAGPAEGSEEDENEWPDDWYQDPEEPHGEIKINVDEDEILEAIDGDLSRGKLKKEFRLIGRLLADNKLGEYEGIGLLADELDIPVGEIIGLIMKARDDLVDPDKGKELKLFPAIVHAKDKYALGYATKDKLIYCREAVKKLPEPYKAEYLLHEALCYRLNKYIFEKGMSIDGHQLARHLQMIIFKEFQPNVNFGSDGDGHPELTGILTINLRGIINDKLKGLMSEKRLPNGAIHEAYDTLISNPEYMDMDEPFTKAGFQAKRFRPKDKWKDPHTPEVFADQTVKREIDSLITLGLLQEDGRDGRKHLFRITKKLANAPPVNRRKLVDVLRKALEDGGIHANPDTRECLEIRARVNETLYGKTREDLIHENWGTPDSPGYSAGSREPGVGNRWRDAVSRDIVWDRIGLSFRTLLAVLYSGNNKNKKMTLSDILDQVIQKGKRGSYNSRAARRMMGILEVLCLAEKSEEGDTVRYSGTLEDTDLVEDILYGFYASGRGVKFAAAANIARESFRRYGYENLEKRLDENYMKAVKFKEFNREKYIRMLLSDKAPDGNKWTVEKLAVASGNPSLRVKRLLVKMGLFEDSGTFSLEEYRMDGRSGRRVYYRDNNTENILDNIDRHLPGPDDKTAYLDGRIFMDSAVSKAREGDEALSLAFAYGISLYTGRPLPDGMKGKLTPGTRLIAVKVKHYLELKANIISDGDGEEDTRLYSDIATQSDPGIYVFKNITTKNKPYADYHKAMEIVGHYADTPGKEMKDKEVYYILDCIRARQLTKEERKEIYDFFIAHNRPFIFWWYLNRMPQWYRKYITYTDIEQLGNFGLMKAVYKFNRKYGDFFLGYAKWCIAGYVTTELQKRSKEISYNVSWDDDSGEWIDNITSSDIVEDREERTDTSMIIPYLGLLERDVRIMTALRYGISVSRAYAFEEIGRLFGYSTKRVRQIIASAIVQISEMTKTSTDEDIAGCVSEDKLLSELFIFDVMGIEPDNPLFDMLSVFSIQELENIYNLMCRPVSLDNDVLREIAGSSWQYALGEERFYAGIPSGRIKGRTDKTGYLFRVSWTDKKTGINSIKPEFKPDVKAEAVLIDTSTVRSRLPYTKYMLPPRDRLMLKLSEIDGRKVSTYLISDLPGNSAVRTIDLSGKGFLRWIAVNDKSRDDELLAFLEQLPENRKVSFRYRSNSSTHKLVDHKPDAGDGQKCLLQAGGWMPGDIVRYYITTRDEVERETPGASQYLPDGNQVILKAVSRNVPEVKYFVFSKDRKTLNLLFGVNKKTGEVKLHPRKRSAERWRRDLALFLQRGDYSDRVNAPMRDMFKRELTVDRALQITLPYGIKISAVNEKYFKKGNIIEVSPVYLVNPPAGDEQQWLLVFRICAPGGKFLAEVFYRFTDEMSRLNRCDLEPKDYISRFAENGVYDNDELQPFIGEEFKSQVKGGKVHFGGFSRDGKQIHQQMSLNKLPDGSIVRISKERAEDGRWLLACHTDSPAYDNAVLLYEFTEKGGLKLYKGASYSKLLREVADVFIAYHIVSYLDIMHSDEYRGRILSADEIFDIALDRSGKETLSKQVIKDKLRQLALAGVLRVSYRGRTPCYSSAVDDEELLGVLRKGLIKCTTKIKVPAIQEIVREAVEGEGGSVEITRGKFGRDMFIIHPAAFSEPSTQASGQTQGPGARVQGEDDQVKSKKEKGKTEESDIWNSEVRMQNAGLSGSLKPGTRRSPTKPDNIKWTGEDGNPELEEPAAGNRQPTTDNRQPTTEQEGQSVDRRSSIVDRVNENERRTPNDERQGEPATGSLQHTTERVVVEIGPGNGASTKAFAEENRDDGTRNRVFSVGPIWGGSDDKFNENVQGLNNVERVISKFEEWDIDGLEGTVDEIILFFPSLFDEKVDYEDVIQRMADKIKRLLKPGSGKFTLVEDSGFREKVNMSGKLADALESAGLKVDRETETYSSIKTKVNMVQSSETFNSLEVILRDDAHAANLGLKDELHVVRASIPESSTQDSGQDKVHGLSGARVIYVDKNGAPLEFKKYKELSDQELGSQELDELFTAWVKLMLGGYYSEKKKQERLDEFTDEPDRVCIIAYSDGIPCGLYTYGKFEEEALDHYVYVLDDFRKRGIGYILYKYAVADMRKEGCAETSGVASDYDPAQALHRKFTETYADAVWVDKGEEGDDPIEEIVIYLDQLPEDILSMHLLKDKPVTGNSQQATESIDPTVEAKHAVSFREQFGILQSNDETSVSFIALSTDWIKGYKRGEPQHEAINPLIAEIRNFCRYNHIKFFEGDDEKVAVGVKAWKDKDTGARGIVLSGTKAVELISAHMKQKGIEKDQNMVMAEVDNKNLDDHSYMRVMEMMSLMLSLLRYQTMKADYIKEYEETISNKHPDLGFKFDPKRWCIIFKPTKPEDVEDLRPIYAAQVAA